MSQKLTDLLNSLLKSSDFQQGHSAELIDALLTEAGVHENPAWASHMTPTIQQPALLGQLLAGLHNGNLLSAELYPQLESIEKQLLDWFCQRFGQQHAHFTHGSSYANLEALWHARDRGENLSSIVYGSNAVHYSIIKACQILGLEFRSISTNEQGQIDTGKLHQACEQQAPIAIVATAGTTSSGAIDPLTTCIAIAQEFNCWCHIDAAWGGALALLTEQQALAGIEQADSVCFDPHKTLGQPRPCSMLLYQQPLALMTGIDIDYLSQAPKQTLAGSYGGELFLPLWLSLLSDREILIKQLKDRLEQAEKFYHALCTQTDWQVFHSPSGIICFRASINIDLSPLEAQGFLSRSKINGEAVWRVVFASQSATSEAVIAAIEPYF